MVFITDFKLGKSNVDLSLMVNLKLLLRNVSAKHFYVGLVAQVLSYTSHEDKFEEHYKPQANKLRAHYDLLKMLKQASISCDQFFAAIQTSCHCVRTLQKPTTHPKEKFFCLDSLTRCSCQKSLLMVKALLLLKYAKDLKSLRVVGPLPNTSPTVMEIMQDYTSFMARSHSEVARSGNVAITRVTKQVNIPPIHLSNNNISSGNHNTKEANIHLNGDIKAKTSMYKKVNTNKNQPITKRDP